MYAVIQAGGRQLKVVPGQDIRIDRIQGEVGGPHLFDRVLFIGGGDQIHVGRPYLEGVSLDAEILEHGKTKKVVIFKKKRRKNYRRKRGFRAQYTLVRVNGLNGLDVDWATAEAKPVTLEKAPEPTDELFEAEGAPEEELELDEEHESQT